MVSSPSTLLKVHADDFYFLQKLSALWSMDELDAC